MTSWSRCSICLFGPSLEEWSQSLVTDGNKYDGYLPNFVFTYSLYWKRGCDQFIFLNPLSGQQNSKGSADVLDVKILPLMTPFFNRKSDTASVSDHLNDAWVINKSALQKMRSPISFELSDAIFSNSLIWNASKAGAWFLRMFSQFSNYLRWLDGRDSNWFRGRIW